MALDEAVRQHEHILVCVSPSPFCQKVIKTASQLVEMYSADFSAICVDAARPGRETEQDRRQGEENAQYAQQLGAQFHVACGGDIAARIAEFARVSGVTKIVIGRSAEQGRHFRRDIAQRLSRLLPGTEIVIVPNAARPNFPAPAEPRPALALSSAAQAAGILLAATLVCWIFYALRFTDASLITVYILAVLLVSFVTNGFLYGAAASILSVLLYNFFFTEPRFTLYVHVSGYPLTLVVMFLSAFLTSSLTSQVKRQAGQHARNAYRTEVLLNSNRRLQLAESEDGILLEAARQLQKLLLRSVLLYPVLDSGEPAEPILVPAGESESALRAAAAEPTEQEAARWVLGKNEQGGATTGIYGGASFWYLAVRMNGRPFAVVGIRVQKGESFDAFDKNLVLAMLGECGVALEKARLDRARTEYAVRVRQEQMRADLLRSISHDLRTPLTSISGSANMLLAGVDDPDERRKLYSDIYDDSIWLIRLVENLLSITKMDDGRLKLRLLPEDVSDLLDAAVNHMLPYRKAHALRREPCRGLLIVRADSALIVQLLINLIENAFKYAGDGGTVVVSAEKAGTQVCIRVADDGPGIPDEEKEKVFDMFYTRKDHPADGRRGLGLGLALCRTIAQAHAGTLRVRDNEPHGAVFELLLPAVEAEHHE